jgi:hypothetical protein
MARDPDALERELASLLQPDARGRLLARGLARGMVWRNGIVPDGGPAFAPALSGDLLDYGYGVLALALELRDANQHAGPRRMFDTTPAFSAAAEAIESSVRRGPTQHPDRGRHLVIAAAAFHLAGYAARSYSLLSEPSSELNLSSAERCLALLLRRQLQALRSCVVDWLSDPAHSDETIAARLQSDQDEFGPEDAAVVALSAVYHRAVGLFDAALVLGNERIYASALDQLENVVRHSSLLGNIPMWWVGTLTRHLVTDLWNSSLNVRLPSGPGHGLSPAWDGLRLGFIQLLGTRPLPQLDLWPSQLDAAARAMDPKDDLIVALPTSAGKTRIAEICILRTLTDGKRVVYVTPLRALSAEVEQTLARTFVPLGASVTSLYGAAGVAAMDAKTLVSATIVVATPEKLDFALRQDPTVLDDVELIVLDEGHMIGVGSREIRYEVLIQRLLRRTDANKRRIVCLSAMFNPTDSVFQDFSGWLRSDEAGSPIHVQWRPTRQLLATLDWQSASRVARLSFIEGEKPYVPRFVEQQPPRKPRLKKPFPCDEKEFCIAAANAFARDGHSVLLYCPQRSQVESLVDQFCTIQRQGYLDGVARPDASDLDVALAVGREWLGPSHPVVRGLSIGVGAHHGALPRPFLSAIEGLLNRRKLPIVVASPTLAQGIDLKCSALIFRAIQRYDYATKRQVWIDPAEFGNVVGRVGRAYVDIDGVAIYPIFATGTDQAFHVKAFKDLVDRSRGQRLISGLARLVMQIAKRLSVQLGVHMEQFLEYVLNQRDFWSDARLAASENEEVNGEDDRERSLEVLLGDLDLALLSLLEEAELSVEGLSTRLDQVLSGSLWKRTLAHTDERTQRLERELLLSRAEWMWRGTTQEQRRACFSSGLGSRAGVFLYEHLDKLVGIVADMQASISGGDVSRTIAAATVFASVVMEDPFFTTGTPPSGWERALASWIDGTAFAEIVGSTGLRERQKMQSFIQECVVFRFVWAVEAVRAQASVVNHPQLAELGDGPALTLTYGVPSIEAALLCQSGFASRVGAAWVTRRLGGSFVDFAGMSGWQFQHEAELSDPRFWEASDHYFLWRVWRNADRSGAAVNWSRVSVDVDADWSDGIPKAGNRVRLLPRGGNRVGVCALDLEPLGTAELPFDCEQCFVDGVVLDRGRLQVEYFGPHLT